MKTTKNGSSPDDPRKRKGKKSFSGNALFVTILLHVIFGLLAAYLIVEHFQKKHTNFTSQPPPASQEEIEHKIQVQKRNSSQSAPQDLKRIVTTSVSDIVLPDPPEVPPPDDAQPTMMSGAGGNGMFGNGTGNGNGNGNGGGGGDPFGNLDPPPQPAFQGTFYDMKQTHDGQSTGMDTPKQQQALKDFFGSDWDESAFAQKFWTSDKHIYSNELIIPFQASTGGPRSFGLDQIRPGYWVIVYHAKISPTRSGDFRLAGFGDDYCVVRIDGRLLLDSGWHVPVGGRPIPGWTQVTDFEPRKTIPHGPWVNDGANAADPGYGADVEGPSFHIDAGEQLTIDVLIGDANPSGGVGRCGYFIMLLDENKQYDTKDAAGNLILPALQINADPKVTRTGEYPPFTCNPEDALVGPSDPNSPTALAP